MHTIPSSVLVTSNLLYFPPRRAVIGRRGSVHYRIDPYSSTAALTANFTKLGQIIPEHVYLSQAVADALQKRPVQGTWFFGNGIVLPSAVLTHADEPGPPQVREVPGYSGLRLVDHVTEVAHTRLAFQEQIQQAQTGFVGESAKESIRLGQYSHHIHLGEYITHIRSFLSSGGTPGP
jgi:hypothetical protein